MTVQKPKPIARVIVTPIRTNQVNITVADSDTAKQLEYVAPEFGKLHTPLDGQTTYTLWVSPLYVVSDVCSYLQSVLKDVKPYTPKKPSHG